VDLKVMRIIRRLPEKRAGSTTNACGIDPFALSLRGLDGGEKRAYNDGRIVKLSLQRNEL